MADLPRAFAALSRMAVLAGAADHYATRRDAREPGRRRKEALEGELADVLARHWRRQARELRERLAPRLAAVARFSVMSDFLLGELDDGFWEQLTAGLLADLVRLLGRAAKDGARLFEELVNVDLDLGVVNVAAAAWAQDYAFDLVKGLTTTLRDALSQAVDSFVRTPGFTIGDVMAALPLDETRAARVATTEITRAYAEGNQKAGEALAEANPGVDVIKIWFTNNDDRVCPVCEPLDGKEVAIDADFDAGIPNPPAHPGCRCWTETSTKIT